LIIWPSMIDIEKNVRQRNVCKISHQERKYSKFVPSSSGHPCRPLRPKFAKLSDCDARLTPDLVIVRFPRLFVLVAKCDTTIQPYRLTPKGQYISSFTSLGDRNLLVLVRLESIKGIAAACASDRRSSPAPASCPRRTDLLT
jgi:hypothetical protein